MRSHRPAPDPRPRPEPVDRDAGGRDRAEQRAEHRPALIMVLTPFIGLLIWAGLALLAV